MCGAEDDTSDHILCECEDLASLKHVHLGFFLDLEDMKFKYEGHLELQQMKRAPL
jgi:hypothetical protein